MIASRNISMSVHQRHKSTKSRSVINGQPLIERFYLLNQMEKERGTIGINQQLPEPFSVFVDALFKHSSPKDCIYIY